MPVIRKFKTFILLEKHIIEFGYEKALILDNLIVTNGDGSPVKKEDLHLFFPFIPKKKFYRILNQLIKDGIVEECNE